MLGLTWKHIGLEDTQHISKVVVDPRNPNIVFVAAVGHASGPNADRGVFSSPKMGARLGRRFCSKMISLEQSTW